MDSNKPIKISVITPTVREEGLEEVLNSLHRQTFTDFEWIVISPKDIYVPEAIVLKDPPKEEGDYWSLNKAYNHAVKCAKGDLIVSIQDHTSFIPEGLAKFWFYFNNGYDKALISGIGDKYDDDNVKVWSDPRRTLDHGTFYECFPRDVEANYCSIPKKALYECGGFDEWLDKYAGMDHISVQERLDELGYKFYLDQTNETFSSIHARVVDWDKHLALNGPYEERRLYLKSVGKWPVLDYLKETK